MKHVITIKQLGTSNRLLFITKDGSLTTDVDKAETFTEQDWVRAREKRETIQKKFSLLKVQIEEISQYKNTDDAANTGRVNYQHSPKESK